MTNEHWLRWAVAKHFRDRGFSVPQVSLLPRNSLKPEFQSYRTFSSLGTMCCSATRAGTLASFNSASSRSAGIDFWPDHMSLIEP